MHANLRIRACEMRERLTRMCFSEEENCEVLKTAAIQCLQYDIQAQALMPHS